MAGPLRLVRSLRPDGRERWLTHLPPDLEAPYRLAARGLAPLVERTLTPAVVANRWSAPLGGPEAWTLGRARLRRRLLALGTPGRGATILRSDVHACYASIGRSAVEAALPPGAERAALLRTLTRIHTRGGVGLPIGPPASAVVANAVLASADRAIAETGALHVRWVDDVLIIADGLRSGRRAFDAWRTALARAGLEANLAKTAFGLDPRSLPRWAGSPWATAGGVR